MENQNKKNRLENISLGYPWTILTGRNRQFHEFSDVENGNIMRGDFIVTIGKRAIIATQVQDGKRVPIIVRRWKKVGKSDKSEYPVLQQGDAQFIAEWFIDSDHHNWTYYHSDAGHNLVNCRDNNNTLIYEFKN